MEIKNLVQACQDFCYLNCFGSMHKRFNLKELLNVKHHLQLRRKETANYFQASKAKCLHLCTMPWLKEIVKEKRKFFLRYRKKKNTLILWFSSPWGTDLQYQILSGRTFVPKRYNFPALLGASRSHVRQTKQTF